MRETANKPELGRLRALPRGTKRSEKIKSVYGKDMVGVLWAFYKADLKTWRCSFEAFLKEHATEQALHSIMLRRSLGLKTKLKY